MPSVSLSYWQNERLPRLAEVEAQCSASLSLTPARPHLVEENLRGYALLLSAHFQGFCRDIYTECAQIIVSKVRPALQVLLQNQFTAGCKLDVGNPNLDNIRRDFARFCFSLDFPAADPANSSRITHLGHLNQWRNAAAHHGRAPVGVTLNLASLQAWTRSCSGLAISLD